MICWKIRHLVSGDDYLLTAETEEQCLGVAKVTLSLLYC